MVGAPDAPRTRTRERDREVLTFKAGRAKSSESPPTLGKGYRSGEVLHTPGLSPAVDPRAHHQARSDQGGAVPRRLLLPLITLALVAAPASAAGTPWQWPVPGEQTRLIRTFEAPLRPYGTGHRGIDLQVSVGEKITAPAPGVVSFTGLIAKVPTLVLDHGGGIRSTYQPITTALRVGEKVETGSVIGVIASGGRHCVPRTCLHLGVRNSSGYLDPMRMLRQSPPVLLPLLRQGSEPVATLRSGS